MERSSLNIVGRIHMCIEVKDNESGKRNCVIERKPKSFLFRWEQVTLLEQEIISCECAVSEHSIKHTSLLTGYSP